MSCERMLKLSNYDISINIFQQFLQTGKSSNDNFRSSWMNSLMRLSSFINQMNWVGKSTSKGRTARRYVNSFLMLEMAANSLSMRRS